MLYLYALIALVALDFAWLSSTSHIYASMLAHLFAPSFSLTPAFFFYPLYALAIFVLILKPAVREKSGIASVVLKGALLGLAAYGAYDLTNAATLRDWPLTITLIDMAWGAAVTAAASAAAYFAHSHAHLKK